MYLLLLINLYFIFYPVLFSLALPSDTMKGAVLMSDTATSHQGTIMASIFILYLVYGAVVGAVRRSPAASVRSNERTLTYELRRCWSVCFGLNQAAGSPLRGQQASSGVFSPTTTTELLRDWCRPPCVAFLFYISQTSWNHGCCDNQLLNVWFPGR